MATSRDRFFTTQPGKAAWTAFALALNLVRLPFWFVYFIPRGLRQHEDWTWKQAVRVRLLKAFLWNSAFVEVKTPLSLEPGNEKDRFVTVQPAAQSYYVGVTARDPEIHPERTGGTWHPGVPGRKENDSFVILHFHGGAYVLGNGRDEDAGFAAKTMLRNTDATHVFCPQYRLSSNPGGRFPAQLQDAITCYTYLLFQLGYDSRKIILSGDSAGANLVLALLRYLADNGTTLKLPNPAAAWLWSPWADPSKSILTGPSVIDSNPNFPTDYLNGEFGLWGAETLQPSPKTGIALDSPYVKFLGNPFKTEVPLYISTGECEVLLRDDTLLAEEFKEVQGNTVGFQIEEHAVHDIILTGKIMGFEKEAAQAARRANDFLKAHAKAA